MISKEAMDNISGFIKRAVDVLFMINPEKTSLGVLFGIIIDGLFELFKPFLLLHSNIVNLSNIGTVRFIILGIFLFNINLIFYKRKFPKEIEMALSFIKDSKKAGKLSNVQVRQMYLRLFVKILNSLKLEEVSITKNSSEPPFSSFSK